MATRILFIHAATPVHAGTGQSSGPIDLAIARERATGIPFLPGSSLKGVLRDRLSARDEHLAARVFGSPPEDEGGHAGSVHFGDARLLFLPVRSLAGTFAYATSPYLLERIAQDLVEIGARITLPDPPAAVDQANVSRDSLLCLGNQRQDAIVFEDLKFTAGPVDEIRQVAEKLGGLIFGDDDEASVTSLRRRFVIVHDDVMSYLLEQATEVRARIAIDDETKIVRAGALWYEEALPAESILSALLVAAPPPRAGMSADKALAAVQKATEGLVQFGGNATIGRGQCRVRMAGGAR